MGEWKDGIFQPGEDLRGRYIRSRMKERYPQLEDEFAVMWYGTEKEKTDHANYRAAVKVEADRLYPKAEKA